MQGAVQSPNTCGAAKGLPRKGEGCPNLSVLATFSWESYLVGYTLDLGLARVRVRERVKVGCRMQCRAHVLVEQKITKTLIIVIFFIPLISFVSIVIKLCFATYHRTKQLNTPIAINLAFTPCLGNPPPPPSLHSCPAISHV